MIFSSKGLYAHAFKKIISNKLALISLVVILLYVLIALAVAAGILAGNIQAEVGDPNMGPSAQHWLGTDSLGRDSFTRVIYSTKIAMQVGLITSMIAIPIGVVLGLIAGYYGGFIDEIIVWFYTTIASIPGLLLILALTLVLGRGLMGVFISIGLSTWVSLCRLIRSETMKLKTLEYVQASKAIGVSNLKIIFHHILPNTMHLVIIYFALQFVYAIKSEVILSYIGVGVQNSASWGLIIKDAQNRLFIGQWHAFAGATVAMFFLVLAFNIFSDALRDAFDPKFKGQE